MSFDNLWPYDTIVARIVEVKILTDLISDISKNEGNLLKSHFKSSVYRNEIKLKIVNKVKVGNRIPTTNIL